ncbi:energy transducer TonB [Luminiphilus sp.]|nr:energy transducer TonB [Luminiphilus sp.]MDA8797065.1 energy transducer TonB [Luminiphilus sp.]MDA8946642.1 energy transducer TonB [Luminiphilus sp.]MDB2690974.1 energy transducer TonB [Luminiphilus sp.]
MKVFSPGLAVTTAMTYALLFAAAPQAFGQTGFFGAYDPRLQEVLWNDAVGLQQNGNHQEAIEKLKRAAHLSRINDGLDAKSQLPFVRAEIASHRALNQFVAADERHAYLSRIEARAIPSGPEKITALLRQAEWHQFALLEDIDEDEEATARMGKAWNFYRRALNESIATYGEDSAELLPALEGMVRAQYLLAGHRGIGASMPGRMDRERRDFAAGKSTFNRGLSVLVAMQQLNRDRLSVTREIQAQDLIRIADWAWWTGNRNYALNFYNTALALANGESLAPVANETSPLTEVDASVDPEASASEPNMPKTDTDEDAATTQPLNAETEHAPTDNTPSDEAVSTPENPDYPTFRILEAPVALPAIAGFGPVLDIKTSEPADGDLIVSFNISPTGKVVNIERVQLPVTTGPRGPERVIRRLRKTRFRPVFLNGEPVESDTITWTFEPKHWAMPGSTHSETST